MIKNEDIRSAVKESWILRRAGRLKEAELKLYEILEKYPENPFIEANLADVFLRQEKLQEARNASLRSLQKTPRQVMALTVLGEIALKEKKPEEAVENLRHAYELSPNSYRAGRLASAHENSGHQKKALNVLYHALEKNPGDKYLRRQHSRLARLAREETSSKSSETLEEPLPALAASDLKEEKILSSESGDSSPAYAEMLREELGTLDSSKAAEQLQKIIRVGKRMENPHLHTLLGDFWRKANEDEKAAQAYRKARELTPAHNYALSQEAFCYRRLQRKEEAWPLLKIILQHSPGDKPARSSFLRDAEDLDRLQEAIDFLAELLTLHPHHKEIYGLIKKLKKKV